MIVIVTDIQYKMSVSLIYDLVENGYDVVACHTDKKLYPLGFDCKGLYECKTIYNDNAGDFLEEFYNFICEINENTKEKPVLLPVSAKTLELISDDIQIERFRKKCEFLCPSQSELLALNDKEKMAQLAESIGVLIPKKYENAPYEFPLVVKPHCGEKLGIKARDRYIIVKNEEELKEAIEKFEKLEKLSPIVQTYIKGDGYGCSVVARDGKILQMIQHKRLREYPISGGPSTACITVSHKKLEDYTAKMVKALNLSGIAMFEFKGNDDEVFFLEINPRVWGTYPLTRVSNSSFSLDWVLASQNLENKNKKNPKINKKMKYIPTDVLSSISYLKNKQMKKGFFGLIDCINPFVKDGILNLKEKKLMFAYFSALFKKGKR